MAALLGRICALVLVASRGLVGLDTTQFLQNFQFVSGIMACAPYRNVLSCLTNITDITQKHVNFTDIIFTQFSVMIFLNNMFLPQILPNVFAPVFSHLGNPRSATGLIILQVGKNIYLLRR